MAAYDPEEVDVAQVGKDRDFRLELRAVFYREDGYWIAHCLEMDVMGHGKTKRVAFERMNYAITEQVGRSILNNNPENIFQPADGRFFEMFAAGKDVMRGTCTLERVSVPDFEAIAQKLAKCNEQEVRPVAVARADLDLHKSRQMKVKIDPAVAMREYHGACAMA
jgi:predicted RNase H-like HicB family nuclease